MKLIFLRGEPVTPFLTGGEPSTLDIAPRRCCKRVRVRLKSSISRERVIRAANSNFHR